MADSSIFSSKVVCDNVAARTLRDLSVQQRGAAEKFAQIISPVVEEISHAKLKRGALKGITDRLLRTLSDEPAVAEVIATDLSPSRLSTNERHHVRFCLMGGRPDWVDFVGSDVTLTRRSVNVNATVMDVRIHRHALVRFMQRERKAPPALFSSVMPALKLAPILGATVAALAGERHIAAPLGEGLLLGRCTVIDTKTAPAYTVRTVVKPLNGRLDRTEELVERETLITGARIIVDFMTYVDFDALTDSRLRLRDLLGDFYKEHREALDLVFRTFTFDGDTMSEQDFNASRELINKMFRAAEAVVTGPVWQEFSHSVGKDYSKTC